ncbi:unnamed protein product [Ilex paraguariensis]|uniref:Uncharacterized protein n=1 Tax=Ilex paraguariensis TaxID=185542 RepID=A0ABC8RTP1_9AQUA
MKRIFLFISSYRLPCLEDYWNDYLEKDSKILLRFSYNKLCSATGKLSENLGGGFGMVLKGVLIDGTSVAVKQLDKKKAGNKRVPCRDGHCVHLLCRLQKKAIENQLVDIVDCRSEDMQRHSEEAIEIIRLGMWCLNNDYTKSPPMSSVIKVLEGVKELEPIVSFNFPCSVISAVDSTV